MVTYSCPLCCEQNLQKRGQKNALSWGRATALETTIWIIQILLKDVLSLPARKKGSPPTQPNIIKSTSSSLSVSWLYTQGAEAAVNSIISSFDTPSMGKIPHHLAPIINHIICGWSQSTRAPFDLCHRRLYIHSILKHSILTIWDIIERWTASVVSQAGCGLPHLLWSVLDVLLKIFLLSVCIDVLDESFSILLLNILRKLTVSKLIQRRRD